MQKKGKERVSRKVLIQNYEYGGLKMVDVLIRQKALICSWYNNMQLILKKTDHIPKWCNIPSWLLDYFGKNMKFLHFNCRSKDIKMIIFCNTLPKFFYYLLNCVLDVKYIKEKNIFKRYFMEQH